MPEGSDKEELPFSSDLVNASAHPVRHLLKNACFDHEQRGLGRHELENISGTQGA